MITLVILHLNLYHTIPRNLLFIFLENHHTNFTKLLSMGNMPVEVEADIS